MAQIDKLIEKFVLANAVLHDGKAQVGAIIGKLIAEDPKYKAQLKQLVPKIEKIIRKVNKLKLTDQEKRLKKVWPGFFKPKKVKEKKLSELPNAKKEQVIMRFAPSPSGPMHIGHAYTLSLNSEFCRKYKGKLIIRIEDTNPENIYALAYKLLPKDANWLTKNNVDKIVIQSDRMKYYYFWAEKALNNGFAYVCTCNLEAWKKLILKSRACPCRSLSFKEQLKRWKKMSKLKTGKAVVRIKTNITHKNPALRDWPALRINTKIHAKTGKKYKVWPLMNFAVAIDDHLLGITHTIRAKEHRDNEKKQAYLYDYFNWRMPVNLYVGAINFKDIKLSTTRTKQLIKAKKFSGWDDVRLPTLLALKRRGYQPEAFIKYAVQIGVSEADKTVSKDEFFKTLDAFNKDIIEPIADRYYFVKNPVKITVKDAPSIQNVNIRLHPAKKKIRKVKVSRVLYIPQRDSKLFKNKEIRLMHLYNIKNNKFVSTKVKDTPKIQWVADNFKINTEVLMPNGNIIKGFAEKNITKLKVGSIIQFERMFFARLDKKYKNKFIFWYTHN